MQKMLRWFIPLLAVGVAIFILFFLISINSVQEQKESQPLTLSNEVISTKTKDVWLNHFSQTQKLGYFYPVNEVYVTVDLNEKIINVITYELSAALLDPYQLFCLKEELRRHALRYYLKKEKENITLLIYSQDVNKLNALVKVLKNYQISATIKPYKEG
ncbi:MAG: hypothetical protein PHU40_00415 [Sulfurimonas sp.]|nr:hypothetical protein [Sulfurimonas sp.]